MDIFNLLCQIALGERTRVWAEQVKRLGRTPLSMSYPIPEARNETEEQWMEKRHTLSPTAHFFPGIHPRVDGIADELAVKIIALDCMYWYIQKNRDRINLTQYEESLDDIPVQGWTNIPSDC